MQYLAVIDAEEVILMEGQAYAVRGNEGGRLIILAWQFHPDLRPDSPDEPFTLDLVTYDPDAPQIRKRPLGEFSKALDLLEATPGKAATSLAQRRCDRSRRQPRPLPETCPAGGHGFFRPTTPAPSL